MIVRDLWDEVIGVVDIVDLATVVVHPVRHHKVFGMQTHVISHYLVEYRLRHGHVGRLVFHDDQRTIIPAIHHRVTPLARAVDLDPDLVGCQTLGVVVVIA